MTKREKITLRAREILASCPEGMRWSELVRRLYEAFPSEPHGTITGSAYNFARSDEVYRPSKGVLCLTRFRKGGTSKETGTCLKDNLVMSSAANMREQLERYAKTVKERWESCSDNEAATGASLILPVFAILGYDVADPRECKPQYKADFGKGRSKQPVDWAFCVNDCLAFLVEAKAAGKKIDRHDGQLRDYYAKGQPEVKLGILTTGVQWRFFTDLVAEHVMDKEPFLAWDVLNDAIPYDILTILHRAEFKPELIKAFARRKRRQSVLVAELTRLLEPSDEFVKLAIQNKEMLFENRNLNARVIAEWKPILASAIQEWAQQQRLTEDDPYQFNRRTEMAVTKESSFGKTPAGGVRSEIYYQDDDGNPVDKKKATRAEIVEYDKNGVAIRRTYGTCNAK